MDFADHFAAAVNALPAEPLGCLGAALRQPVAAAAATDDEAATVADALIGALREWTRVLVSAVGPTPPGAAATAAADSLSSADETGVATATDAPLAGRAFFSSALFHDVPSPLRQRQLERERDAATAIAPSQHLRRWLSQGESAVNAVLDRMEGKRSGGGSSGSDDDESVMPHRAARREGGISLRQYLAAFAGADTDADAADVIAGFVELCARGGASSGRTTTTAAAASRPLRPLRPLRPSREDIVSFRAALLSAGAEATHAQHDHHHNHHEQQQQQQQQRVGVMTTVCVSSPRAPFGGRALSERAATAKRARQLLGSRAVQGTAVAAALLEAVAAAERTGSAAQLGGDSDGDDEVGAAARLLDAAEDATTEYRFDVGGAVLSVFEAPSAALAQHAGAALVQGGDCLEPWAAPCIDFCVAARGVVVWRGTFSAFS